MTILADRGFGDQKLFAFLGKLGFGYVIRFRGNIHVTAENGETKPAAAWVGKGGRAPHVSPHFYPGRSRRYAKSAGPVTT